MKERLSSSYRWSYTLAAIRFSLYQLYICYLTMYTKLRKMKSTSRRHFTFDQKIYKVKDTLFIPFVY